MCAIQTPYRYHLRQKREINKFIYLPFEMEIVVSSIIITKSMWARCSRAIKQTTTRTIAFTFYFRHINDLLLHISSRCCWREIKRENSSNRWQSEFSKVMSGMNECAIGHPNFILDMEYMNLSIAACNFGFCEFSLHPCGIRIRAQRMEQSNC